MSASASSSNRFPEIEKYELIEEIGHGGMATVYRARDERLEREVAVKVIHKHLRENQEVRRRFVAEAKAVAKLRHAGIVDIYSVSDEEDVERYLVVELIRGMSLRQLLQDRECLPPEVAAMMVAVLCDAVEHAHNQGVIHRDIKPENVLIELPDKAPPSSKTDQDGEDDDSTGVRPKTTSSQGSVRSGRSRVVVKLTDFGIAKVLDAQGVTSTGQILGSPAHMAPEQIEGGTIGRHTDVFALGVLMYECMVGHLPFEGQNPAQVLRRVLEGDFDPADSERAAVGGRWARIIAGALANDIEQRTASAAELGRLIDEELEALGIEDPRGEMVDYFVDEEAYHERSVNWLVPRLLERGEAERRAGNVPDAASDFNRALALRPDDLAILKRITTLSAETVWRERILRGGVIVLGSLVLGGAAFGLTKVIRTDEPEAVTIPSETASAVSAPAPPRSSAPPITKDVPAPPTPDPSADPAPSASPSSVPVPAPVGPQPVSSPNPKASADVVDPPAGTRRPVAFRVFPNSVQLTVNGQTVGNNDRISLSAGTYAVSASAKCCKSYSGSLTVHAPDQTNPSKPQIHNVTLELKPATVSLGGAPNGATLACPQLGLVVAAGSSGSASVESLSEQVSCVFSPGGKTTTITLVAGGHISVAWPL